MKRAIAPRRFGSGLGSRIREHWQLYLFLALPLLYLLLFKYYPMLGLQIAFKKYTIDGGIWGSAWIGLDNLKRFFSSYQLKRILPNTLILSFYSILASFPIPIILALGLNSLRGEKFKKFAQTATYLPHFISTVVLVGMLMQVFNARTGMFGVIYDALFGHYPKDILGSSGAFRHLYVWSGVWQSTGWNSIIYIATLAGVDPALHEAAQIDGASRLRRVWHVDLPAILPTVSIMLILSAGNIMNVGFEKVYLMQNTLNLSKSEIISTYVYNVGLAAGGGDFSYATAIGFFNSVINLILIVTVNQISKVVSKSSLW